MKNKKMDVEKELDVKELVIKESGTDESDAQRLDVEQSVIQKNIQKKENMLINLIFCVISLVCVVLSVDVFSNVYVTIMSMLYLFFAVWQNARNKNTTIAQISKLMVAIGMSFMIMEKSTYLYDTLIFSSVMLIYMVLTTNIEVLRDKDYVKGNYACVLGVLAMNICTLAGVAFSGLSFTNNFNILKEVEDILLLLEILPFANRLNVVIMILIAMLITSPKYMIGNREVSAKKNNIRKVYLLAYVSLIIVYINMILSDWMAILTSVIFLIMFILCRKDGIIDMCKYDGVEKNTVDNTENSIEK